MAGSAMKKWAVRFWRGWTLEWFWVFEIPWFMVRNKGVGFRHQATTT